MIRKLQTGESTSQFTSSSPTDYSQSLSSASEHSEWKYNKHTSVSSRSGGRLCSCCPGMGFVWSNSSPSPSKIAKEGLDKLNGDTATSKWLSEANLRGIAFGSVMFASSALNNLFLTYHLNFFITVGHLSPSYFYIAQIFFMIWNACNDVIFGWLSDTLPSAVKGFGNRLPAIRFGGILWALAFWLAWFPWGGNNASPLLVGINFTMNLCVYDAMLTLVEVNYHALLAEISTDDCERAGYNSWSSICAALGSLTSLFGHHYWKLSENGENKREDNSLDTFRNFALFVALFCALTFELSTRKLKSYNDSKRKSRLNQSSSNSYENAAAQPFEFVSNVTDEGVNATTNMIDKSEANITSSKSNQNPIKKFITFLRDLGKQRNFVVFTVVSSIQTFDCSFGKNFFTIFLDLLVGDALSPEMHGLLITASFLLPWLTTALLSRFIEKGHASLSSTLQGVWLFRLCLLFLVIFLAMVDITTGLFGNRSDHSEVAPTAISSTHQLPNISGNSWFALQYLSASLWSRRGLGFVVLINRVASECVCRLVPLIESDLIDEYCFLHPSSASASSMSASLVGTANFISKPSQSLGPMVGFALISYIVPQLCEDNKSNIENFSFDDVGGGGGGGSSSGNTHAQISPHASSSSFSSHDISLTLGQRSAVAAVVLFLPLFCVLSQQVMWRKFTLKGNYLLKIKQFLVEEQRESEA